MPRQARVAVGDIVYHVINRAKGTQKEKKLLAPLPIDLPHDYVKTVNEHYD